MKRLLSGTLAVLMALGLCGCGSKPDNTAQEPNYTATETPFGTKRSIRARLFNDKRGAF